MAKNKSKNSDKQFMKVPVNWQPYMDNGRMRLSWESQSLYIAYLYIKRYSRFGRVHISNVPKRSFGYWLTKLISVGFITRQGDYYVIKGYNEVFRLLGVQKCKVQGVVRYRWRKLDIKAENWSEFKKEVKFDIQGFQTERKKLQFKKRLSSVTGGNTSKICPLFSAKAAANLFGYKSRVSGSKYREKFFDIVKEPLVLRKYETNDGLPYFKFDCKKIYLKKIYH